MTVESAASIQRARELLRSASPPNASFTQQRNFSDGQIDRALELGFRKPEWVWAATDAAGRTLGVVGGWGSRQRRTPIVIDFLDVPRGRPDVVRALLDRAAADSAEPGRTTIDLVHFVPAEATLDDAQTRGFIDAVEASGFRFLVRRHRYRLDTAHDAVNIPNTDLRFVPAASAGDPRLRAVMAEILVGSLDAHDKAGLARSSVAELAEETIAEYLGMDPVESMFLAYDPDGETVGLVIGGLRGTGQNGTAQNGTAQNGTASFIGVSHRHRGNGYAAQLLGFITRRMIDDGAAWIVGETDEENFPMVAAFSRVGYPTNESRLDFVRELSSSSEARRASRASRPNQPSN